MVKKIDFSIDEQHYPIQDFKDVLNRCKVRYVPIIDAGIHVPKPEKLIP
jgi:hypothetical protein